LAKQDPVSKQTTITTTSNNHKKLEPTSCLSGLRFCTKLIPVAWDHFFGHWSLEDRERQETENSRPLEVTEKVKEEGELTDCTEEVVAEGVMHKMFHPVGKTKQQKNYFSYFLL
jgi:hypothetical protein